ncbi:MAG: nuclear transport factor 2 family protein [Cyanobacteriota bacterium ELA615]
MSKQSSDEIEILLHRSEIQDLCYRFADAVNTRKIDNLTALWSDDGIWKINPPIDIEIHGTANIATAVTNLLNNWEFFVQKIHGGVIDIDDKQATARWTMSEIGRSISDKGFYNLGVYIDKYVYLNDSWLFAERIYEFTYIDESVLPGKSFPKILV